MARMRYLKPEFFTDADLGELPPLHRLVFQGLWCHADRDGRLEYKPRELKIQIVPYDACDFVRILDDLAKPKADGSGFIVIYEADGKRCIAIPRFRDHQKTHPDEKSKSLPEPPHGQPPASREISRSTTGQQRGDGNGDGDFNGNGDGTAAAPLTLVPDESPADLQRLWNEEAHADLPRWRELTKGREKAARARLKERGIEGPAGFRAVIRRISASAFCRGQTERGSWRADPEWLLKPDTAAKVLEGKYDDRSTGPPRRPADVSRGTVRAESQDHGSHTGEVTDVA